MLGRPVAYDRTPYFFSDQYDLGIEYRGFAPSFDRVVYRGDPASHEFVAFWLHGSKVVAAMNVNVWDVGDAIEALLQAGRAVDPQRLADPDVDLTGLAEP
jgi:3-phenylpropionate/trans-cinnamate dioxygenase ferredoxin reductase subunit